MEQVSEFALLEQVVIKLAAIVQIGAEAKEPELKEDMDENDLMVMSWIQDDRAGAATKLAGRKSGAVTGAAVVEGLEDHHIEGISCGALKTLAAGIVEALQGPYLNTLDMSDDLKVNVACHLVFSCEGSYNWVHANVQAQHVVEFVNNCEAKYNPNPFHNFAHAVDVAYTVFRFFNLTDAAQYLSETSMFWLLIAAVGHDLGHLGVNNQYLIECSHELAIKYNDRSPLENMHCSTLFQVTSDPEANVFARMEKDVYKEARKGIIGAILHTDITLHGEMVKELGMLYQMNSEQFDNLDPGTPVTETHANVSLVLNALLHCADVNNPMKPWDICRRVAHLCLDEYFAQGDIEKKEGMPVQMLNDRDKVNRPNSQLGFIEFLILPFVELMVNTFPQLDSMATFLGENMGRWSDTWKEETAPGEEAVAKLAARVAKVQTRCKAVTMEFRDIDPGHHK